MRELLRLCCGCATAVHQRTGETHWRKSAEIEYVKILWVLQRLQMPSPVEPLGSVQQTTKRCTLQSACSTHSRFE